MSSSQDQANSPAKNSRDRAKKLVLGLQDEICAGLEIIDGEGKFLEETWERDLRIELGRGLHGGRL